MMLITFGIHLYEKCTKNVFVIFVWYIFKTATIKKKKKVTMVSKHTLVQISLYPCKLAKWTIYASILKQKSFFFLNLMPKRGGKTILPPPQFLKVGRAIAPSSFAHEVVLVKFELQDF
jgi:hypothetical protein